MADARESALWQAWHAAAFARMQRLPPLMPLLKSLRPAAPVDGKALSRSLRAAFATLKRKDSP